MIDFGSPFEDGMRRAGKMLFQPFHIGKWLALGFMAWMAEFFSGTSIITRLGNNSAAHRPSHALNFLPHSPELSSLVNWTQMAITPGTNTFQWWDRFLPSTAGWFGLVGIIMGVVLLIFALIVWLGMRGKFMFLDNVVHNRHEIRDPWKKFRAQANSLFLTWVVIMVLIFIGAAILAVAGISWFGYYSNPSWLLAVAIVAFLLILLWLLAAIVACLYLDFGIPIMYCTGCFALEAAERVWNLVLSHPLDIFVYVLIRIVMEVAFAILKMFAGLITCCVGLLPYVNTVLTLPIPVFRQSFILDCLVQLDSQYNAWTMTPSFTPPVQSEDFPLGN
ncbi:MAG: hypothetical protein ABI615_05010 [Chthoniobacterales bacterium]